MSTQPFTVTVRQASERTGISIESIRELITAAKIIAYKPAGVWLIDWESLKNYITTNKGH